MMKCDWLARAPVANHGNRCGVSPSVAISAARFSCSLLLQIEKSSHQINHRRRLGVAGRGFQGADRSVHDLVDDAPGKGLDGHLLIGREWSKTSANAVDLCLANRLEMVLQRNNRGYDVERLDARVEALHLRSHDGLGALGFLATVGDVAGNSLLQVVNVVDEDPVKLVHRW